jgi:hypothetical protein
MEEGRQREVDSGNSRSHLAICYQQAWEKLKKYYDLTDNSHHIYCAGIVFHPALRDDYFEDHWTDGELPSWIPIMISHIRDRWEGNYRDLETAPALEERPQSTLDAFIYRKPALPGDEFDQYIKGNVVTLAHSSDFSLATWWRDCKYRTIRQYAFDIISTPATSSECERVFSSAKRLITPSRNKMNDDLIEAMECLKAWWSKNLLRQRWTSLSN